MARRSLKPQLNQIRAWVHAERTDAWIAHQLGTSAKDIAEFRREHKLEPPEDSEKSERDAYGPTAERDEVDLRAEDEARVAAALEEEARKAEEEAAAADDSDEDEDDREDAADGDGDGGGGAEDDEAARKRRRRGRRGGRGRKRGAAAGGGGARKALEGTFDHGEDGYGLWLDPAVQDDPVYAEHWAGHRPVTVTIEQDKIIISRRNGDG